MHAKNDIWKVKGNRIIYKNKKSSSILYLLLMSFSIILISIMILFLSMSRFFVANQIRSLISIGMSFIFLVYGLYINRIAKKAKKIAMETLRMESLKNYNRKIQEERSQ